MNKEKIIKIIRWCALLPFLALLLFAFFMTLGGLTFGGTPIALFEGFLFILILAVTQFWWVFLISIIILICTSISLSKNENPIILKIIRTIAILPFILLLWIVLQNIIGGGGLTRGIEEVFEFLSEPESPFIFIAACITIIVTSLFIRKKTTKDKS